MAKSGAVWGIDIGQSALKALRCRPHESDEGRLVVEAFDYVEYPKLLSQPDAEPEEIVREAIATFLERNELKGDRVAMSVPGQAGLARYIKLPPVEAKKIPDIVKYEAKQQIPFQLEDVVWDYQRLAGGNQDEGFALETEIGLFAMKRDQVARSLEPLRRAGVEVDLIQLAPLALYNYACFDRLADVVKEPYDPASPPPAIAVLSLGVDTTDLVVTNGFRVWQRSIQIGGSHFTKALTKELKLTFAKAEHLKKNAADAEDRKAVFQAMRQVFSDLVAEINRSIGFCTSNNPWARSLSEVVAIGNAMKLPGLQRYLGQNLDVPVKLAEEFPNLAGGSVTAQPAFQQNELSFPVAYGLCVQALGRGQMGTNLLPGDIVVERMIRAKKPWAAAAAAALMAGLAFSYSSYVSAYQTADLENDWKQPMSQSQQFASMVQGWKSENDTQQASFDTVSQIGKNLASNVDGRLLWLELWQALSAAIPKDTRPEAERKQTAEDVSSREEIHITAVDCKEFDDLATWFTTVQAQWDESQKGRDAEAAAAAPAEGAAEGAEGEAAVDPAADPAAAEAAPVEDFAADPSAETGLEGEAGAAGGPTGPGWVIQLRGYHFHNSRGDSIGQEFVRNTLIKNLLEKSIPLPDGEPDAQGKPTTIDVSFKELGISHPVVITKRRINDFQYDPAAMEGEEAGAPRRPAAGVGLGRPRPGGPAEEAVPEEPELWKLKRYDFVVQFAWKPTLRHTRELARKGITEDGAVTESSEF